jgi:ketosteroid isomerase-like protein
MRKKEVRRISHGRPGPPARDRKTGVVVLGYASEGRAVRTGAAYSNRYVSVLTITERKVTR